MQEHQIRRIPVVDDQGRCVGIIAQADIALHAPAGLSPRPSRKFPSQSGLSEKCGRRRLKQLAVILNR